MTYPVLLAPDRLMPWVQQIVPQLERDREAHRVRGRVIQEPTSSSGTLSIDLNDGAIVYTTLVENVTSLSIIAPEPSDELEFAWRFYILQDNSGSHTFSWSGIVWPGGTPPTVTSTADRLDIFDIVYTKGTHHGRVYGQDYA